MRRFDVQIITCRLGKHLTSAGAAPRCARRLVSGLPGFVVNLAEAELVSTSLLALQPPAATPNL